MKIYKQYLHWYKVKEKKTEQKKTMDGYYLYLAIVI